MGHGGTDGAIPREVALGKIEAAVCSQASDKPDSIGLQGDRGDGLFDAAKNRPQRAESARSGLRTARQFVPIDAAIEHADAVDERIVVSPRSERAPHPASPLEVAST